eukprot:5259343-Prymnesium_polylepis.1
MQVDGSPVSVGYGISGVCLSAGQMIAPILVGMLVSSTYASQNLLWFVMVGGGLLASVAARFLDRARILDMTAKQLRDIQRRASEAAAASVGAFELASSTSQGLSAREC